MQPAFPTLDAASERPDAKAGDVIRVLVADDHAIVHECLRCRIHAAPDMCVLSEVRDLKRLQGEASSLAPDVLVLDLFEDALCVRLAQDLLVSCSAALLVIATHDEPAHLRQIMRTGARGYVRRARLSIEIAPAIRTVASGHAYVDIPLDALSVDLRHRGRNSGVTTREADVLRLSALGYSNKEVGAMLGITEKTIEAHKANAMQKLNLHGRVELVQYALLQGWLKA